MPQQLRNPIPGSLHPWALSKRITDSLLGLVYAIFVGTNRRVFARIVRRQTRLEDPRMLPKAPRWIAFSLCCAGTFFLFLAVIYAFASKWDALPSFAFAMGSYLLAAIVLSRVVWGLRGAFREAPGRLAGILRRAWQVMRNELP